MNTLMKYTQIVITNMKEMFIQKILYTAYILNNNMTLFQTKFFFGFYQNFAKITILEEAK